MNLASLRIAALLLGLSAFGPTPFAVEPGAEKPSASAPETKPLVVTQENASAFYRDYKRLTAQPRLIAPLTAVLCGIPSKGQLDKEDAVTGPHSRTLVHLYANPEAAQAIAAKTDAFPIGSVIVKEKLGAGMKVTNVGGMIKRAPGYDTANGDWEFFFHTPGGEFTSGKTANCIDCHNNAPRDHVFSVWKLSAR